MRELSALNKASGGKAVKMVEFSATPGSVILKGEAASKEDAEAFKTAVSGSKAFNKTCYGQREFHRSEEA